MKVALPGLNESEAHLPESLLWFSSSSEQVDACWDAFSLGRPKSTTNELCDLVSLLCFKV